MRSRRAALAAAVAVVALVLAGAALAVPASAAPSGLVWTLRWDAPTTAQGPNPFSGPPVLSGTAAPAFGQPSRVDATVTASAPLPAGCGTFPRSAPVELQGSAFVVRPDLACNGSYTISVVATAGQGLLAARSPALTAPLTLADAGGLVAGLTGAVADGRTVALSWSADPDPDVIGYRLRRDGIVVADIGSDRRTVSDEPGSGTFRYDLSALRWGGGGPGSEVLTSPSSGAFVARVVSSLPSSPSGTIPAPFTGGGTAAGSGPAGAATGATGAAGSIGPAGPLAAGASGASGSRRSSSGGAHGSSDGTTTTTLDDGFAERLPYRAGHETEQVAVPGHPATRDVSRTVRVPHGTGLLIPLGLFGMFLGASILVRRLVQRAAAVAAAA